MIQEVSPPSSKKPVIAVDLDEVLGEFVLQLCAWHNDLYGTVLSPQSFSSYNFHEVWGGTRTEADSKMRAFFLSSHFLGGIRPIDGAADVLRKHSQGLSFYVVTSRQDIIQDHTREWIDAHYPGIFADLHFGNHFSTQGVVRSKPDLCKMINAEMIIDDNTMYANECALAGIRTLLFGDYAWNRTSKPLPDNVQRVLSWAEVDAVLQSVLDRRNDGVSRPYSSAQGHTPATEVDKVGDVGVRVGAEEEAGQTRNQQQQQQQQPGGREDGREGGALRASQAAGGQLSTSGCAEPGRKGNTTATTIAATAGATSRSVSLPREQQIGVESAVVPTAEAAAALVAPVIDETAVSAAAGATAGDGAGESQNEAQAAGDLKKSQQPTPSSSTPVSGNLEETIFCAA